MWYFSHKAWGKSLGDFPLTFCSPSLRNLLAPSSHEKRKKSPPPLCIGLSDVGLNHYYQRRVLLVYVLKIFNHPCTSLPQVKEVWGASKNVTREGEGGKAFLSTFTLVGEERGRNAIGVAWAIIQYDSMRELLQFFSNLLSRFHSYIISNKKK